MFIMVDSTHSVSIENTNFIASIYNIGDKLFFTYSYDGKGNPVVRYESEEEAIEVVCRIYEGLRKGEASYILPSFGFMAKEKLLNTDLTEYSGMPNNDGLPDYIIDHMRVKLGYKTLGDVVELYDTNCIYKMPESYNQILREFLGKKGLELTHDIIVGGNNE